MMKRTLLKFGHKSGRKLAKFLARPLMVALIALSPLLVPGAALSDSHQARFLSVIEDLPLMDGMVEVGEGVRFESDQGRLAEATAEGLVTPAAARAFYAQTLPQLGWSRISEGRYGREGEVLSLSFEGLNGGQLKINFSLKPR